MLVLLFFAFISIIKVTKIFFKSLLINYLQVGILRLGENLSLLTALKRYSPYGTKINFITIFYQHIISTRYTPIGVKC